MCKVLSEPEEHTVYPVANSGAQRSRGTSSYDYDTSVVYFTNTEV